MERSPATGVVDDFELARAYALADFEVPHSRFIEHFRRVFPGETVEGVVLDLGCGSGDVTMRFAYAFPECRIHALDGAESMLMFARQRVDFEMLHERVRLFKRSLPTQGLPKAQYDVVLSHGLLHHLADPQVLWQSIRQFTRPGGAVFVMDYRRAASQEAAAQMVRDVAGNEPRVLQQALCGALLAAFTPEEVRRQLDEAGLEQLELEVDNAHHLLVHGRM